MTRIAFSKQRRLGRPALLTIGLTFALLVIGYLLALGLPHWLGQSTKFGFTWSKVLTALIGLAFLSTASRWGIYGPLDAGGSIEYMPHAFRTSLAFGQVDLLEDPGPLLLSIVLAAVFLPGAFLSHFLTACST